MQKTSTELPEIQLLGISVRTSNKLELEKTNGRIFPCVMRYFHEGLCEKIPNRARPGVTFCAYTDYESDYTGEYTYFVGEAVTSYGDALTSGFEKLIIPQQNYIKFTTNPEPMPDVLVHAWGRIWQMSPEELGGKRRYLTDFEIYDERASDHQNCVVDLYIGIYT
jgi:predicted transcriptional regulator YdeE